MIYSLNFNLTSEKTDYKGLYRALRNHFDASMRLLDAMWIIQTDKSADDIYKELGNYFDNGDFVIFQLQGDYEGWLDKKKWDFINDLFLEKVK
ncbi:hypothetical protein OS242_10105 [Tumebacillus sp. DT12]|uniref:SinR family protein n=1 Tax=Tumebacillus lacus TaxID=2995335 RepID=A0ABT3X092_9BACL|nr:hypothetical protein [Tumebacillus lacus]MCX7570316.1 hypothetical protein [Tumebacillus lacus]